MLVLNTFVVVPAKVTSLRNTTCPWTNNEPAIPAPPATYNALSCNVEVLAATLKTVAVLPTTKSFPTATPPRTCKAPVCVELALVVLVTVVIPPTTKLPPTPTPPNGTVNAPVAVVPACVADATITAPVSVLAPPTTKLPPIPAPPNGTTNAPVFVVPACAVPSAFNVLDTVVIPLIRTVPDTSSIAVAALVPPTAKPTVGLKLIVALV